MSVGRERGNGASRVLFFVFLATVMVPYAQGRNHGIDIGGGPNVSPPPDIFFFNSVAD